MKLQNNGTAWTLEHNGTTILSWDEAVPLLYVGCGQESVDMYRGNYFIEDYVAERRPLRATAAIQKAEGLQVDFSGERQTNSVMAAASRCPISTSGAGTSPFGPRSPVWAGTRAPTSPGRRT